jgi:hypothetical protein
VKQLYKFEILGRQQCLRVSSREKRWFDEEWENLGRGCIIFVLGADVTCLSASYGDCHIIGNKMKKKHEVNIVSSRVSMTMLRIGSAARETGPTVFLFAGTHRKTGFTDEYLVVNGAKEGSSIAMTDTGYMTKTIIFETAKARAIGIRKMDVICEQLDWWAMEIWKNCAAHFCDARIMESNCSYNIILIYKEGDTSHLNQADRADKNACVTFSESSEALLKSPRVSSISGTLSLLAWPCCGP